MSSTTLPLRTLLAIVIVAVGVADSAVRAGESDGLPVMQKPVTLPFLKDLVGSWTGKSRGAFGDGSSTATFSMGIGGTALLADYANTTKPPGVETAVVMHAHGVLKVGDDGTTVTCWWFDDQSATPLAISGATSPGECAMAGSLASHPTMKARMVWTRKDERLSLRVYANDSLVNSEEFTRSPK